MRSIRSLCAAALVAALVPACNSSTSSKPEPAKTSSTTTAPPATPAAPPAAPAPAASGLDDARIAAIVVAANQVDIDAGALAAKTSKDTSVQALANQMVTDHTAVNKAAVELVTRLGVTPVESDTSRGLVAAGEANRTKLASLTGADFDRAYVDNEVAYHQQVIDAVDKLLLPSAQNAELKKMLTDVRPALVAHLEHARQVQAGLAGGGGGGTMSHAGH